MSPVAEVLLLVFLVSASVLAVIFGVIVLVVLFA